MCYTGDNGYSTVWRESWHVARKQHRCVECGGPIPVGTRHQYVFHVFDGEADQFRAHAECIALWEFAIKELCNDEGVRAAGELREELGEYGGHGDDGDEPGLLDILDAVRDGYEALSRLSAPAATPGGG